MSIADKETLKCIKEEIQSIHRGVEYSHKQYHDVFERIDKLLRECGI